MSNADLWARREAAVARGVGTMHARFTSHAKNAVLWDVEGNRYIDFATGIAVNNTGHSDPRIVEAVKDQLDKFSHSCYQVNPYESYIALAEKLNAAAPGDTPKKSIFLTTGAEAVENAVKIARAATGRPGIIAFKGGFHGRTMMGMALTGKVAPYKIGFGPFPSDVFHAPYPIDYHGVTEADSLNALDAIFKADIEPSRVAAIILEPVQGEGGFYAASPSFMQSLRSVCDEHGILLICDEIQTGFARTGKLFATEYSGVEPDLMTVAKAMAGGFPISGVVGKAEVMDAAAPGGLGGTYGGSPLGCVAGLKVMEIIEQDDLCDRANEIGDLFNKRLTALQAELPNVIGNVRNLGAMIAMELVEDGDANKPNAALTGALVKAAAENGLILLSCGVRGNVIRFLPALTAPTAVLEEGLDILATTLKNLAA
ncbi:4-aminobutyrate--2-oxoglutarate transaminase [Kordiimonas lacus]|uniref:4-aminobutyrate aminotransferase / (S)-3-amino-2-methylpropionate transaminase n=1 Tax=Kordiimonas lacus TaxID=637679 RepID=A0A1G7D866_9PROT|nr:4-aminobutyrate--2-oxoglutarate transaminase [Kordiimonas lacus]SDE47116.1 4-aminobutyrate aminotransferase / (S)-3-amino-2-methylpropionate transaminase [Kordiimonas lacus]